MDRIEKLFVPQDTENPYEVLRVQTNKLIDQVNTLIKELEEKEKYNLPLIFNIYLEEYSSNNLNRMTESLKRTRDFLKENGINSIFLVSIKECYKFELLNGEMIEISDDRIEQLNKLLKKEFLPGE